MESKISILFLYSSSGFGGLVTNLAKTINCLDRTKFNIFLVSIEDNNPCMELLDKTLETKVLELNCVGRFDLSVVQKLKKIVTENKIHIINSDGYKADFYTSLLRLVCRVKTVCILHGWVSQTFLLKLYQLLDRFTLITFDKIILVSPVQLEQYAYLKLFKNKIVVVPNAIDIKSIQPKKMNKNNKTLIIGTCSRLAREKQIDVLIKACAKLNFQNWELHIVGAGEEYEYLKSLAIVEQVDAKVRFCGYQSKVEEYLIAFDVFVTCSMIEGLPNTILEAGAMSLPVIASNIPEHKVVIRDKINGLLFKLGNSQDLADKIQRIFNESEIAEKIGLELKNTIETNFSMSKRKDSLENLYYNLKC